MSLAAAEKARTHPNDLSLADERQTMSWSQLDDTLNRAANAMLASGLAPGQRIGVFANNSAETVLAYLAGLHAGISSIPINFHLTAEEVAYILKDGSVGIVFVGPETAAVGVQAAAMAGVDQVVGWRSTAEGVSPPFTSSLTRFTLTGSGC